MWLRVATMADLPALQSLIATSVRSLSTGFYTAAQIEAAITEVFGVDTQLIADRTYYVIVDAEEPVAIGGWSSRRTLYGGDQMKGGGGSETGSGLGARPHSSVFRASGTGASRPREAPVPRVCARRPRRGLSSLRVDGDAARRTAVRGAGFLARRTNRTAAGRGCRASAGSHGSPH